MSRAGLATRDHPIDPVQLEAVQTPEQRLGGDEPDGRRCCAKQVGALHPAAVLDRYADPHVRRPGQARRELSEALRPLGQHLERVLWRAHHHVEDGRHVLIGDRLVE